MLNSKLSKIQLYLGINTLEDWTTIEPAMLLRMDGIGPVTLDYIRLMLANRGLTLRNDNTAEHWKNHPRLAKVIETIGEGDRALVTPFKILIDSAEQMPFPFRGILADGFSTDILGNEIRRPWIVQTDGPRPGLSLGRHPDSKGDYSIDGYVGRIGIERKSMADLQSTILGWTRTNEECGRRERFECELENLSQMEVGVVVVEANFNDVVLQAPEWGKRTKAQNAKTLGRSILSYMADYKCRWAFCGGRREAEVVTFRLLERFWRKENEAGKEIEKLVAVL